MLLMHDLFSETRTRNCYKILNNTTEIFGSEGLVLTFRQINSHSSTKWKYCSIGLIWNKQTLGIHPQTQKLEPSCSSQQKNNRRISYFKSSNGPLSLWRPIYLFFHMYINEPFYSGLVWKLEFFCRPIIIHIKEYINSPPSWKRSIEFIWKPEKKKSM